MHFNILKIMACSWWNVFFNTKIDICNIDVIFLENINVLDLLLFIENDNIFVYMRIL